MRLHLFFFLIWNASRYIHYIIFRLSKLTEQQNHMHAKKTTQQGPIED